MHNKGHDARRKDIILHEGIPGSPKAFKDIELNKVVGNLIVGTPIGIVGRIEGRGVAAGTGVSLGRAVGGFESGRRTAY